MKNSIINPTDLAKRTKDSSRTVSLRIKEKTWLGFEQLAKDNHTTANAMISELADYYIEELGEHLDLSDEAIKLGKFKELVNKAIKRMCRLSIDEVMEEGGLTSPICYTGDGSGKIQSYLGWMRDILATSIRDGDYIFLPEFPAQGHLSGEDTSIYPTTSDKASFSLGVWQPNSPYASMLRVPFVKMPDVIYLLKFIEKEIAELNLNIVIDADVYDAIVLAINEHDYDYGEEVNRGVLSVNYNHDHRRQMLDDIATIFFQLGGKNEPAIN